MAATYTWDHWHLCSQWDCFLGGNKHAVIVAILLLLMIILQTRHVAGSEWWICDLSGSRRKLMVRIYDPIGSLVENTSKIYDLIGSDDKPMIWIYDPSESHDSHNATEETMYPGTFVSISGKTLWIAMCDDARTLKLWSSVARTAHEKNLSTKIASHDLRGSRSRKVRISYDLTGYLDKSWAQIYDPNGSVNTTKWLDLWSQRISRQNEMAGSMISMDLSTKRNGWIYVWSQRIRDQDTWDQIPDPFSRILPHVPMLQTPAPANWFVSLELRPALASRYLTPILSTFINPHTVGGNARLNHRFMAKRGLYVPLVRWFWHKLYDFIKTEFSKKKKHEKPKSLNLYELLKI